MKHTANYIFEDALCWLFSFSLETRDVMISKYHWTVLVLALFYLKKEPMDGKMRIQCGQKCPSWTFPHFIHNWMKGSIFKCTFPRRQVLFIAGLLNTGPVLLLLVCPSPFLLSHIMDTGKKISSTRPNFKTCWGICYSHKLHH